MFSPENAHNLSLMGLKLGLLGSSNPITSPCLKTSLWGLDFPNPIGLAAGYDKNAEVPNAILELGFGSTEVGTITPKAQPGNPRPRIFRLQEDEAIINQLGFNNKGLEATQLRLKKINTQGRSGIIGANVGANKTSRDPTQDYVIGLKALEGLADYYVINISSPNTPGLRALQSKNALENLLKRTIEARNNFKKWAPLLLKVAPDLTPEDIKDISEVALNKKIDGLVISNTTISRPLNLKSKNKTQGGGLSGKPLLGLSTKTLAEFYKLIGGKIPLIGVGGVNNGISAYKKVKSGASLIQIYSALVYEGPSIAGKVALELETLLQKDGFKSLKDAIGADLK